MPASDDTRWSLQDARDHFSQLIKAAGEAPQTVTVHGKPAAVVLSAQAYARLKSPARRKPLSADLLQPGLLDDATVDVLERVPDAPSRRDIGL